MRYLCLIALTVAMAAGAADRPKLARDLPPPDSKAVVDVIIQFKKPPGAEQHRKVRDRGGKLKAEMEIIKGAVYSVPANVLPALAEDDDIAYISPVRGVNARPAQKPESR